VRIGAHTVEPLALNGDPINTHIRVFCKQHRQRRYVDDWGYDFDTAIQAMEQAVELGRLTSANSNVLAVRLSSFDPEEGSSVNLGIYGSLLEHVEGALQ